MQKVLTKRASLHRRLVHEEQLNIDLKEKLEQVESLANVGLLSAMIAHEINNILTPLGNYAEMAMNNPDDEYINKKAIEKAANNSVRATKILSSLLSIASGKKQPKTLKKVSEILDNTLTCMARDLSKDGIKLDIKIPEDTCAYCDPIVIQQVFLNLILNAREAMLSNRSGRLTITAKQTEKTTIITVGDTGHGIPEEIQEQIFEPFFSTKSRTDKRHNAGAGLGLAYCKRVIEAHHGDISVASELNAGTIFTIELPLNDSDG